MSQLFNGIKYSAKFGFFFSGVAYYFNSEEGVNIKYLIKSMS
ncbi:hypothetical protein [Citrobacter freundii]|uniref:Uncharacterized protein n=1 Tax=Citrobacter freundii TaxID=546 RepID=A0A7G2IT34_CITFR|nr:hypothetical protein [Citrobacter freundii]